MAIGQFGDQCLKLNTGQQTTGAAAQLIAANGNRRSLVITNVDSTNTVYLGTDNTDSATTGHALPAGQSISFNFYVGAIWTFSTAGTPKVTYCEEAK